MNDQNASRWQRSSTRRLLRWLGTARGLGSAALGLAGFVTLIALLYGVENWRGSHAWNRYRRGLEARGEKLDWRALLPAPVPNDQNFAAAPLFEHLFEPVPAHAPGSPAIDPAQKSARYGFSVPPFNAPGSPAIDPAARLKRISLYLEDKRKLTAPELGSLDTGELLELKDWQRYFAGNTNYPQPSAAQSPAQDVLLALSQFEGELRELQAAAARPHCRFPIDYSLENPASILLPHLARVRALLHVALLRAVARLEAGRSAEALTDLQFMLRLSDASRDEPFLISFLVRLTHLTEVVQGIREGLVRHAWSDEQLSRLERALGGLDLLVEYQAAMRAECAMNLTYVEYVRTHRGRSDWFDFTAIAVRPGLSLTLRFMPSGWYYDNMRELARVYQEHALVAVDPNMHRVTPRDPVESHDEEFFRHSVPADASAKNVFAKLFYPATTKVTLKVAQTQSRLNQARIVCALERYRLAHGQLPEALDALRPFLSSTVPSDLMSGAPLRYRRSSDTAFQLYSVGWNRTDDGGRVVMNQTGKRKSADRTQGDWVWPAQ